MLEPLGAQWHQFHPIGRGQPDTALRDLATEQDVEQAEEDALGALAGLEYARNSGTFRVHPRHERWPIAPEPDR